MMFEHVTSPWSAEALTKVGSFLDAYTARLEKKFWCRRYHYIDAFSRAGLNKSDKSHFQLSESDFLIAIAEYCQRHPEQVEFARCLPMAAFEISNPFKSYTLIEQPLRRDHALNTFTSDYEGLKIRVVRDSCVEYLHRLVRRTEWKSQRALLFLDPFMMQINWETLVLLAHTKAIDVLFNFPVGSALQRKLPRDSANLTDAKQECLDRFFGSTEWFDVLYSTPAIGKLSRGRVGLEGESESAQARGAIRTTDPGRKLVSWYRNRLATIFGAVSMPALIRNENQAQLYYLMFAAHKASSVILAQTILELGVPVE